MREFLEPEPPKLTLTRVDTPSEFLEAQDNPDGVKLAGGAVYSKLVVPGLSHQPKQFTHTKNRVVTFTLDFITTRGGPPVLSYTRRAIQFFERVCRPRPVAGLVSAGGAPRLLLVVPGVLSMQCTLEDYKVDIQRQASNGAVAEVAVELTLEEIRDAFIDADSLDDGMVLEDAT